MSTTTCEELLRLDVRDLREFLALGMDEQFEFTDGAGRPVIMHLVTRAEGLEVCFRWWSSDLPPAEVETREIIPITTQAGRYGGAYAWWTCPGCGSRRGVLYERHKRFQCRCCLALPYRSQRLSHYVRTMGEAVRLEAELGLDGDPRRSPPRRSAATQAALVDRYLRAVHRVHQIRQTERARRVSALSSAFANAMSAREGGEEEAPT